MSPANASKTAVIAFPGFGCRDAAGYWHLCLSGVVLQTPDNFSFRQRMLVKMLGGIMKASKEELSGQIFQDRITPFMAEGGVRKTVEIELGGQLYRLRRTTRKNGHFQDFLTLPEARLDPFIQTDWYGNRVLNYQALIEDRSVVSPVGKIHLLETDGLSIISDIDDTIKESGVGDRRLLLTNTFLREFRTIEGMSEVYRNLSDTGASFHYVSSSPWQLYESLLEMKTADQFPPGTIHLRNFRLRDQLLNRVILRRPGKVSAIRFLLEHLPQRSFVLIGDSGEKDPEIYGKICRKYPQRIKGLFIRETPFRPLEEDRFQRVRRSLPHGVIGSFQQAEELQQLLNQVTACSSSR